MKVPFRIWHDSRRYLCRKNKAMFGIFHVPNMVLFSWNAEFYENPT